MNLCSVGCSAFHTKGVTIDSLRDVKRIVIIKIIKTFALIMHA